jgi:hypothetical protein
MTLNSPGFVTSLADLTWPKRKSLRPILLA